jgi:Amidohydrolase family
MTVVISGDRITKAGPSRRVKPRRGDRVVDGRGKYLIPGLWDLHVHIHATLEMDARDTSGQTWFAPHFAANGITGVRSMFDSLAAIEKLRADIAAGRVVGPRIVDSGPILDGERPFWPGSIACANAEQGRAAVERLKREGADFVKVYDGLPRDAYFAIAEEAKRVGLSFAGHLPNSVTIEEASDAGHPVYVSNFPRQ